jgi:hypothetical protein
VHLTTKANQAYVIATKELGHVTKFVTEVVRLQTSVAAPSVVCLTVRQKGLWV